MRQFFQLLILLLIELAFSVSLAGVLVNGQHVEWDAIPWNLVPFSVQDLVEDHRHGGGPERRRLVDRGKGHLLDLKFHICLFYNGLTTLAEFIYPEIAQKRFLGK